MQFSSEANYFVRIESVSSRIEMTQLLAELFRMASAEEAKIISYLSLGLLRPPYRGTQFNIAEKLVRVLLESFFSVSKDSIVSIEKKSGDLGTVFASLHIGVGSDLSVVQVYEHLIAIEKCAGSGSQDQKLQLLSELLRCSDRLSGQYIIRIVLGKLRLGFSDMTIIDALSWMEAGDKSLRTFIEHAYNMRADIGLVAWELKQGGIAAIKSVNLAVGIPIRPAAAERLPSAQAIYEKIGNCVAQPKLDGFRLQVHIEKRNDIQMVTFFSRHLQNMSGMFPELCEAALQLPIETFIAEGEAIGYDVNSGEFLPFQETVKRRRKHSVAEHAEQFPLKLFLFDLLYYNGSSLLQLSHTDRRKILLSIVPDSRALAISSISEEAISSREALRMYFQKAIADGLEGVVVKRPNAPYKPGKRNWNWIKLKREEHGQLEDTLDCVILGYYFGSGKRAQFGIGAFLVGVYNMREDRFETIAKVGTGLTDQLWREMRETLDAIAVSEQPKQVVCSPELTPDVWVDPQVVVVIRADEITISPAHSAGRTPGSAGYALRFPRYMGKAIDKLPTDATTVVEVANLYRDQRGVQR